ncbi:MAG TPA: CaiB/BaiF CoA-transferase family protein [Casimicrobiaceae bacterium]|nr:CaiB/BaiF CoA-transferase family protein [Casimicrobiaceae bacterium]
MAQAFAGIRVLDLTHVLAGPFCTYQLALLGADVVKIEPPDAPDCARGRGPDAERNAAGLGLNYEVQGGNKRALALDLKQPAGRDILLALVAKADVLVENYRTGALAALGLADDVIASANGALVHCSLTGFGQRGPRAQVNAYDNVIQATSGVMLRTGSQATGPVKTGASFVDYATGWCAAFAIAAALLQRMRDGRGQRIDCAMFDAALTMMGPELAASLAGGDALPREAGLGCYATADGHVMLGAFTPAQNRRLWQALARPDFAELADWPALWTYSAAMHEALEQRMRERSSERWITLFREIGIPAERVRTLDDAAHDAQLAHRPLLARADASSPTVPVAAFDFAHDPPHLTRRAPRIGEHTEEILRELGLSVEEIARLREANICR